MTNITYQLAKQLNQFGLNPKEWSVEWVEPNFQRSDKGEQVHNLHVVNTEDRNFYFEAEASLKKKSSKLIAKWQSITLAAI